AAPWQRRPTRWRAAASTSLQLDRATPVVTPVSPARHDRAGFDRFVPTNWAPDAPLSDRAGTCLRLVEPESARSRRVQPNRSRFDHISLFRSPWFHSYTPIDVDPTLAKRPRRLIAPHPV